MRTSRIVTFAAAIAITAMVLGAAALFPINTHDAAKPEATAPVVTTTLEPVVVVATR